MHKFSSFKDKGVFKNSGKYGHSSSEEDEDEDGYSSSQSPDYYSSRRGQSKSGNKLKVVSQLGRDYYYNKEDYNAKNTRGKEPAYKMNKYQTVVLKIQIHCHACVRKVKKAIADIDGVESISVDLKQNKVSVTGYIDPKKVLEKVEKTGKYVEVVGSGTNYYNNTSYFTASSNKSSSKSSSNKAMLEQNMSSSRPYATRTDTKYQQQQQQQPKQPQLYEDNFNYNRRLTPTPGSHESPLDIFSEDNASSCSIM